MELNKLTECNVFMALFDPQTNTLTGYSSGETDFRHFIDKVETTEEFHTANVSGQTRQSILQS
jgi:hypothetical protein